jgi:hypothetical protein
LYLSSASPNFAAFLLPGSKIETIAGSGPGSPLTIRQLLGCTALAISGKEKGAPAGKLNAPFHFLPECTAATEGATRAEHRGIAAHPRAARLNGALNK